MKQAAATHRELQFVSFYIGDALYGLDIRFVKEVNTNTAITMVPLTQGHISGLVNIRGQIVMVIDSSVLFGGHQHALTMESHLIILKTAYELEHGAEGLPVTDAPALPDKPVALLVDRIGDVVTVPHSATGKAPQHMSEDRARFVQYVVKTNTVFLVALDPGRLIAGENPSSVSESKQS